MWIPKLYNGRNRTFFFFAEQSTRTRSASNATATVPLTEWRNGDFSNLRTGAGAPITLYDPSTAAQGAGGVYFRTPLPGNLVPRARMDRVALNMIQYWPAPNATPVNQFTQQNNFFSAGKARSGENRFDARVDHNFNDSSRFGPAFPTTARLTILSTGSATWAVRPDRARAWARTTTWP